jgi:hypothetical protein
MKWRSSGSSSAHSSCSRLATHSVLDKYAVLHKTERQSKAAYINQRVSQVSGKALKAAALLELVTNTMGDSVRYTRADIRYDVERGLLELQRAGAEGSGSGV